MSAAVFLAVDLGAESGRLLSGRLQGRRLALEEMHRFPNGPVGIGGHLYWDVLRLWMEVQHGLAIAARKHDSEILSIGVDTWGVDYALLDRNDELVGTPYHYRHRRTEGMIEEACRRMPREEIYRRSGIQFIRINTLYQLLAMAVERSPQLQTAESLLMMPDLFHFWLSGEKASEFTDATTTQFYDPTESRWSRELLERMEIPPRLLPRVVPAGTTLGELRAGISAEAGIGRRIQVVAPGTHDTASAVAATPLADDGSAFISSGTWSLVGMELRRPVITSSSLALNFTNEGGVNGTYRLLRNVTGLWLIAECQRAWLRTGREYAYQELTRLAEEARPFRCLIDPDESRFMAPPDMTEAIRSFCRDTVQPEPESPGEFVRCCLESLALKYRWVIERLEELTERKIHTIHVVGGGAQNRLLNQFTADATGKQVIAGPVEATAAGNALVQAMGLGYLGSHTELREVIRRSFDLDFFEPRGSERWEAPYGRVFPWLS